MNAFNLSIAAVGGQVGCMTLGVIIVALIAGLWLDKVFNTKPIFTVLLMLGSIPVTIVMMLYVVRSATARLVPGSKQESQTKNENPKEENGDSGKTS